MKRKIKITESQMRKIIDRISEGEYHMDEEMMIDEEEQMTVYEPEELQTGLETGNIERGKPVGVKDNKNVVRTITVNEELLDEDIFEEEELLDEDMDYREALNKLSDMANKVGVSLSDLDEKTKDSFVSAIRKSINPENELAKTKFRNIDSWDDVPMA